MTEKLYEPEENLWNIKNKMEFAMGQEPITPKDMFEAIADIIAWKRGKVGYVKVGNRESVKLSLLNLHFIRYEDRPDIFNQLAALDCFFTEETETLRIVKRYYKTYDGVVEEEYTSESKEWDSHPPYAQKDRHLAFSVLAEELNKEARFTAADLVKMLEADQSNT